MQVTAEMKSFAQSASTLILAILPVLCATCATAGSTPCSAARAVLEFDTIVHPGDEVNHDVVIDSVEPVSEAEAFEVVALGRRLLGCRKCSCLPRCSRCRIMSCTSGVCNGLCKVPTEGPGCSILRCSSNQSSISF
eukprot:jgi/Ulvmu1/8647/UM046_0052.1